MTFEWTGWQKDHSAKAGTSPYVDWLDEVCFDGQDIKDGLSFEPLPLSPLAAEISGRETQRVPLPPFARPKEGDTISDDPMIRLTWMPDQDNAIVGIIDSGIALSHARFRRLDGGTRFLSAWLQGGNWRDGASVPFGRELFRTEIDQLMFRAVAAGAIDEAEFDRQAGATQFGAPRGDRRLENNATHGTFVADLAAGYDLRLSHEDEHRRRLPMIAVGLPPNASMGASGNFLEFFALHAIEYIIKRADDISKACDHPEDKRFPIIINMSYGLQAGPKDGHSLTECVIRAANQKAEQTGRPIRVMLPAGNDLVREGCAVFDFGEGFEQSIDWKIKPEDQTPNYAELWSDLIRDDNPKKQTHPFGLQVAPPSGPASEIAPGQHGQMNTLMRDGEPVARIYCRKHEGGADWHRMGYIVCTAPTLQPDRTIPAPAGMWKWTISADMACEGFAYVQSDQNLTYGSNTGLLSTFQHKDYLKFDDMGYLRDVATYSQHPVDADIKPPKRRRGTLNSIATLDEARVIGSYRASDGEPAIYSSSASSDAVGDGRDRPTCLLPGEDGLARFGLMAAGSKSGSAATMSGTSFSTALATRVVSQAMLDWIDAGRPAGKAPGTEKWMRDRANEEDKNANWPGKVVVEKGGDFKIGSPENEDYRGGRMTAPSTGRMPRA